MKQKNQDKAARLAAALRENLRKRKLQDKSAPEEAPNRPQDMEGN